MPLEKANVPETTQTCCYLTSSPIDERLRQLVGRLYRWTACYAAWETPSLRKPSFKNQLQPSVPRLRSSLLGSTRHAIHPFAMRSAVVLLQLSLWVSVSHAFYPWFPKYRCDRDGTCQAAKREQVDGDAGLTDDAVQAARESRVRALPIRQRVASVSLDTAYP